MKLKNLLLVPVAFSLLVVGIGVYIYLPLPEGLGGPQDRFMMYLIEPFLRVMYYYPADRVCTTVFCRLHWTRFILVAVAKFFEPRTIFDYDSNLELRTEDFNGVMVRTYTPYNRSSDGAILFIHGGGFVVGTTVIYEGVMRKMATESGVYVASVEYRLSPETFYPGGLNDCETALEHLVNNAAKYGVDNRKIVVMGDSAGGNLAASIAQRRREKEDAIPLLAQILIYPLLQFHNLQLPSYRHFSKELTGLAFVDPLSVASYFMLYAGLDVHSHPMMAYSALSNGHVSSTVSDAVREIFDQNSLPEEFSEEAMNLEPVSEEVFVHDEAQQLIEERLLDPSFVPLVQKNLSHLPQTYVFTCEFDVLRDEGAMYARRLKNAGIPVIWNHSKHGFHAMLNFHNELHMAHDAIVDMATYVRDIMAKANATLPALEVKG